VQSVLNVIRSQEQVSQSIAGPPSVKAVIKG